MSISSGTKLGRYEILAPIGKGEMGGGLLPIALTR